MSGLSVSGCTQPLDKIRTRARKGAFPADGRRQRARHRLRLRRFQITVHCWGQGARSVRSLEQSGCGSERRAPRRWMRMRAVGIATPGMRPTVSGCGDDSGGSAMPEQIALPMGDDDDRVGAIGHCGRFESPQFARRNLRLPKVAAARDAPMRLSKTRSTPERFGDAHRATRTHDRARTAEPYARAGAAQSASAEARWRARKDDLHRPRHGAELATAAVALSHPIIRPFSDVILP